ncbi:MAG TPA: hypothetical protein PKX93_07640, partial [bacterium]|nr:hypothetical protein [bacterium]
YAGCILKSAVGEEENGYCSMVFQRKKASWIKTVYDEEDLCGREPIIHWDGRADTRNLDQYLLFARKARSLDDQGFFVGGSLLCHLPGPDEEFHEKEWRFTVGKLQEIGFDTLEIDFCPTLEKESALVEKANILRWYRTVPALVKSVDPGIAVFPKMLNLRWGLDFQLEMASAAVQGGADGLVVANRIYLSELGCTHGGRMLRQQNLLQVREIHRAFPRLPISATGG